MPERALGHGEKTPDSEVLRCPVNQANRTGAPSLGEFYDCARPRTTSLTTRPRQGDSAARVRFAQASRE
jgi:hypothetical protein